MNYIDLHLHLDGAVTVDIARKLAQMQNISLPEDEGELEKLLRVPEGCLSLTEFLKCFDLPLSLMQTAPGLTEAVRLVADNIKSQGVVYGEIRFAPQLHTRQGLSQEDAIVAALEGLKKTDLKANLILCLMRGQGNEEENEETFRLAGKYLVEDGGVVALDLAGAEALFPTAGYKDIFKRIKEAGIPFTIHAGEADGPESIRVAIECGARRIGHGVRIREDEDLLKEAVSRGITLEMCPTSNRMTHAVEDMKAYPLIEYMNRGLKVTLNTDDMGIEGTTLEEEFRYMEREVGLTPEQENTLISNSIQAAFTTEEIKAQLSSLCGIPLRGKV